MLRVSMRTDYGIRAAIELATHYGKPPVSSAEIAARQEIPEPYLDQLLITLRKAGIIRSSRGPLGGHSLAKDPRDITLAELVAALEGRTPPAACFDEHGRCQLGPGCPQRDVWTELDQLLWNHLRSVTMADLVDRQAQLQARAMYYI
ncbi:MAG: Rrf2 family transcriptional regulator [Chloroflexi bacterium]|nr:Rrf2 family transcriptional regulator [Chloroflexota bacterium]